MIYALESSAEAGMNACLRAQFKYAHTNISIERSIPVNKNLRSTLFPHFYLNFNSHTSVDLTLSKKFYIYKQDFLE